MVLPPCFFDWRKRGGIGLRRSARMEERARGNSTPLRAGASASGSVSIRGGGRARASRRGGRGAREPSSPPAVEEVVGAVQLLGERAVVVGADLFHGLVDDPEDGDGRLP